MKTLEGTFDLGFTLVSGKIRLGLLLYRRWGGRHMKRFNFGEEKTLKWAIHAWWYRYQYQKCTVGFSLAGTGTTKCCTGTTLILPLL